MHGFVCACVNVWVHIICMNVPFCVFLCLTITCFMCIFCVFIFIHAFLLCFCLYRHKKKEKSMHVCLFWHVPLGLWWRIYSAAVWGRNFSPESNISTHEIRITSSSAAKKCWLFSQRCGLEALEFLFKVVRTGTLWCQIYPLKVFPRTKLARHIWSTFKTVLYLVLCCERVCAFLNDLKGGSN